MEALLQQLVNGLGLGGQYALWAVGYGLVYQVLGLMHFAHGDTIVFGAFVALTLLGVGVPFAVAALVAMAVGALLALSIEKTVYSPLVGRGEVFLAFVGALAAAFILRNIITAIWGYDTEVFRAGLVPEFAIDIGGVRIPGITLLTLGCALAAVALFQLYVNRTRMGQAILAVAQGRETAALMGIPVSRVVGVVYCLSGVVGVFGILLYLTDAQALNVNLGFIITIKAFIAALIGGLGSIRGAVIGGLILGILEALIAGFVSTVLLNAFLFGILLVLLVVSPYGIMGRKLAVRL